MVQPDYSVVIPVYNNEATLEELIVRIDHVFKTELNKDYEMILIDDASLDRSWARMMALYQAGYPLRLIRLASNIGQHRATLVGFQYCRAKRIITIDADLQHQPEDIPRLIEGLSDQVDMVIADYRRSEAPWWRQIGTGLVNLLLRVLYKKPSALSITSFKIYQGPVIEKLRRYVNHKGYLAGWILRHQECHRIVNITVNHQARQSGRSSYKILKLASMLTSIITQALCSPKIVMPYQISEKTGF